LVEKTFYALARYSPVAVVTSALVAGCVSPGHPEFAPPEPEDPYREAAANGVRSSMQASTSCNFSSSAPPPPPSGGDADAMCPCTRRPGPRASPYICPPGADWGVEVTFGPEGGSVALRDTPSTSSFEAGVLLEVPPGALAEPTTIRIIETSLLAPTELVDQSPIYVFEPVGLAFAVPVSVRIPSFSGGAVESGQERGIYWSSEADPCRFEPLADSQEQNGSTYATVSRLGWAMVGYPLAPLALNCP
jgi:hypothetical protein